jgi:hypothetical protein
MTAPQGTGIVDKHGAPIHTGDEVVTKFRGGKRTGIVSDSFCGYGLSLRYHQVESVVDETGQAQEEAGDIPITIKNPPKVVFTDQVRRHSS